MAWPGTTRTITHNFLNADGTAGSGTVDFTLSGRMTNSGVSLMPSTRITSTLDGSGNLSVSLPANDDSGTTPTGVTWQVTIRIAGAARTEEYFIVVPTGSGSVDLGTLLPAESQVE